LCLKCPTRLAYSDLNWTALVITRKLLSKQNRRKKKTSCAGAGRSVLGKTVSSVLSSRIQILKTAGTVFFSYELPCWQITFIYSDSHHLESFSCSFVSTYDAYLVWTVASNRQIEALLSSVISFVFVVCSYCQQPKYERK